MPDYYTYGELTHHQKVQLAIRNVLAIDPSIRPLNTNKKPGGLLEFPEDDNREVIIVGDLHANKQNLKAILMDSQNLYKLKQNKVIMIFLGDSVHDERVGHLQEMDTSIEIMDIIIHLINDYPDNVFYLLGNHDTFSELLGKSGIKQGLAYHNAVQETRGKDYVNLMQTFYNSLPVFVIHKHFLAVHAGPVRGGIYRDELIDIRGAESGPLLRQLTWNRLNETRSSPSKKEYGPDDLDRQRAALGCSKEHPFIVGHNPMWKWGTDDSVWVDILDSKNHVILYSNLVDKSTYLTFNNSLEYKIRHADLKQKKQKYLLGDM
ncbi:MAG: metallophosphoesterase [Deltaproteobacteria bacterium]|nr:metallophosphoesterase [Deltaproteobacteria bacterium]